jgi:GNAT superfamily N-acetyltransferase
VQIREATEDEYGPIGELAVRVYLSERFIRPDSHYPAVLRDVASRAEKAHLVVAVDDDGRLLGTVTYARGDTPYAETTEGPDESAFRMLVVDPDARGRGVGAALVAWCIDRARADGATLLRLSTQPEMTAAGRLYQRLGFVRTPDKDWVPEPHVTLVTYALAL